MKKYFIIFCLASAIAFAPVSTANAKYHHGNGIVAAAVGGAVAGLVGAVVQSTLTPSRTVVVKQPTYTYVEPAPFVVRETVVVREPYHYRPVHHVRYVRHHHRHR